MIVDGGELVIDWDETSGHVFMTGPVEVEVFAADVWARPGREVLAEALAGYADHVL